jgi:hypothetical protein
MMLEVEIVGTNEVVMSSFPVCAMSSLIMILPSLFGVSKPMLSRGLRCSTIFDSKDSKIGNGDSSSSFAVLRQENKKMIITALSFGARP